MLIDFNVNLLVIFVDAIAANIGILIFINEFRTYSVLLNIRKKIGIFAYLLCVFIGVWLFYNSLLSVELSNEDDDDEYESGISTIRHLHLSTIILISVVWPCVTFTFKKHVLGGIVLLFATIFFCIYWFLIFTLFDQSIINIIFCSILLCSFWVVSIYRFLMFAEHVDLQNTIDEDSAHLRKTKQIN